MAFRQLVTPSLNPVIYEGNTALTDWYGWCLAYVRTAFGAGFSGSNAAQAAESYLVNRHNDQNLPSGVYVPIFFSGYGGLGHAAIYKDGTIWSTPITHKPTPDTWSSIAQVEKEYGVTFLCWAEGMAGKQFVESVADAPSFTTTITPFEGEYVVTGSKWNLDLPDFNTIASNPVDAPPVGPITFTAQLKRSDLPQYTYYLQDGNVHQGYNSLDCQIYTVPISPLVTAPVAPPAAPLQVNKTEKYTVVTPLPYYDSLDNIQKDASQVGTLPVDTYIVWEKQGIYWNLTSDNMHNQNKWVDTVLNKIVVTTNLDPPPMDKTLDTPNPTAVADTVDTSTMNWRGTLDLRYAGMYVFYNHNREHEVTATIVDITDLDTGKTIKVAENGQYAQFSGKVKFADGNWYGRLKDTTGTFKWYVTHIEDLVPYNEFYGAKTTIQEREILHTLTISDRIELGLAKIKTIGSDIWDILNPKESK